jgi:hypothetical protein
MNELDHAHLESIGKFWLFHPPQLSLPDAKQAIQNVSSFASAGVHNGLCIPRYRKCQQDLVE